MRRLLRRARRMTIEELRWRTGELVHTTGDRLRARVKAPQWDPRDIEHVLAPKALDASMRRAIAAADWKAVDRQLIERMRSRPSRFVIDPGDADAVRDAVLSRWPDAAGDAAARADRILGGRYDLLGYRGLAFGETRGEIDWHFDPVHRRHAPKTCWVDVPYLAPECGDHKIIWELNRHQYWLQLGRAYWLTGDDRYAAAIVQQLESWLAANPPLTGINWASMLEIGFRAMSWTAALHFLLATPNFQLPTSNSELPTTNSQLPTANRLLPTANGLLPTANGLPPTANGLLPTANGLPPAGAFLIALHHQLTHVERHLSYYFSPNTHLTGEALALYVVGSAFPELSASARWIATGRRVLLKEIDRQVLPDGGHVERSTHYQRYTLDFYLLAMLTARRTGDVDAERSFRHAAERLAVFTQAIADDNGCLPLIGDDDGGMLWPLKGRECNDVRDSLAIAALALDRPDLAPWGIAEEACWIMGTSQIPTSNFQLPRSEPRIPNPEPRIPSSVTFPSTGYVVLRGEGEHAVFDAGAHGYLNGGHAHADALSINLTCGGRPLLVDPGTSTYTVDARLRDRMRSSFNHNTISIDGRSQSVPAGPFHWHNAAAARVHGSRHNAAFDWVEGAHDGYAPIEHRRAIVRANGSGWLIVDAIEPGWELSPKSQIPNPKSQTVANWHFHPSWMVRAEGRDRLHATHIDGGDAWLLTDGGDLALQHGNDESGLGWFAPVYGTLIPTWTASITRSQALPMTAVTWVACARSMPAPMLERIEVLGDPSQRAVAARVVTGPRTSTYLIHIAAPDSCDGRAGGIDAYQTNARVLHLMTDTNRFVALDLADASHALALRDGGISVSASEPVADLHVAIDRDVLVLHASQPPRQLRLEGRLLRGTRAITLNGRTLPAVPGERTDTIVIAGDEWAERARADTGKPFALDAMHPRWCEEFLPLRESSW